MVEPWFVEQGDEHIDRAVGGRDQPSLAQLEEQPGQADGDADARQFRLAVVAGKVVVASARTDRTDLRVRIERGLVDDAGVVVQACLLYTSGGADERSSV